MEERPKEEEGVKNILEGKEIGEEMLSFGLWRMIDDEKWKQQCLTCGDEKWKW